MEKLPKPKVYFYVFFLLLIYFSIEFYKHSKASFVQLNFNWKKERIIHTYDNVTIDSVAYNYISIIMPNNKIISPQNTYNFKTLNNNYYFRVTTIEHKENLFQFKHIYWLKNTKPNKNEKGSLLELDLPLIQKGNTTLNTIGDTFLIYNWANYFRKFLNQQEKIIFVGNKKDVFSYPHDAYFLKTTNEIAKNIKETSYANKYILFMGNHDQHLNDQQIITNWETILNELTSRNKTKQIYIILLPPSKNTKQNTYRIRYNSLLKALNSKYKTVLIDTYKILDIEVDLDITGNYPNKKGYKKIAKIIYETN